MIHPKRGEVHLVRFDPAEGYEIKKTRPALILQNDIGNKHSSITIVAAITTKFDDKLYPTEVMIEAGEAGLSQDSVVKCDQIRSVDKTRLVRRLGRIKSSSMDRVDQAIMISLGLVDL